MGAVFERNQTSGATVLRAMICPAGSDGVVGVAGSDGVFNKYGKVATPCTQCPTNMVTREASGKVTGIQVPGTTCPDSSTSKAAAASEGYYTVESCFTKPGYGE
jgi:hypothetical protein